MMTKELAAFLNLARAETRRRLADQPMNHAALDECVAAGLLTRVQHPTPDLIGFRDDGIRYKPTPLLEGNNGGEH